MSAVETERIDGLFEAKKTLESALAKRYYEPPHPEDWLVLGRIAESLELFSEAERIYRSVEAIPEERFGPDTIASFAQAGLARVRARMAASPASVLPN